MLATSGLALFSVFCTALAANIQNIAIGYNNGFDSSLNRTAAAGDVLAFHFAPTSVASAQHSLAQTSRELPCVALPGGFSTGAAPANGSDFALKVMNASNAVYYACIQHCRQGEVGTINAPLDLSSPASFEAFVRAAMSANESDFTLAQNATVSGSGIGAVVLSAADTASAVDESERVAFPSWAYVLVLLGVAGTVMGVLYLVLRRWLRRRHAEWLARRMSVRGEADSSDRDSVMSKTLVDGARRPSPFDGFPI